jgi:hypothetical protein
MATTGAQTGLVVSFLVSYMFVYRGPSRATIRPGNVNPDSQTGPMVAEVSGPAAVAPRCVLRVREGQPMGASWRAYGAVRLCALREGS